MKTHQRIVLAILLTLFAVPTIANAQRRRRPALRRPAPAVVTPVLVPIGTNLKVRLNDTLSSKDSRVGDKFTATVIDPVRFNEGTAHGHIKSILKSGKVQGRTTMNLAFDSIDLPGDPAKHGALHGYVTRIYGTNAKTDEEGGVQSESRGKQTLKRSGIGATAGAIIGGIAGGGKGAAIGLILGGAGGAGSLAINGHKELKIESGTEMLVHVTR
ncbi:MAG TPA: hypothetical protein VNG71_04360 [Pyrinomonadaceae bacterium]|nr:hypothetical protein [Pyrinomonadaceae bacterium]